MECVSKLKVTAYTLFRYISSIKVSPKQYNIPYKAYACLIFKKIRHTFFQAI